MLIENQLLKGQLISWKFSWLFWPIYNDQTAEVTPNGGDCKGIPPKMADRIRVRIYNKLPRIVGGRTTTHQKPPSKHLPKARHCHPERNAAPGAETKNRNGSTGWIGGHWAFMSNKNDHFPDFPYKITSKWVTRWGWLSIPASWSLICSCLSRFLLFFLWDAVVFLFWRRSDSIFFLMGSGQKTCQVLAGLRFLTYAKRKNVSRIIALNAKATVYKCISQGRETFQVEFLSWLFCMVMIGFCLGEACTVHLLFERALSFEGLWSSGHVFFSENLPGGFTTQISSVHSSKVTYYCWWLKSCTSW